MAIEVNEFIESEDINAIIKKFNNEATIRKNNKRLSQEISQISLATDEFEAAATLANDLRIANTGLRNIELLGGVTEDRCQPFNATVLTDAEDNLLKGNITSGDTEIAANFALTLDKYITSLSNQSTSAVLNEQGTLEANTESFESYDCSCDVQSFQTGCQAVDVGCYDCFDCSTTHNICGKDLDCCDEDCGCDIEEGCSIDDYSCGDECLECYCVKVTEIQCSSHSEVCPEDEEYEYCEGVTIIDRCKCQYDCNNQVCNESGCVCYVESCPHNGCGVNCPLDCPECGCNGECSCEGECCDKDWCGATQTVDNSYTAYSIIGEKTSICNCDSVCSDFYNVNPFNGDNKGYLVCNGVSDKSITLINMIANGNLSHDTVGWYDYPNRDDRDANDKIGGYRAFRSFKIHKGTSFARQYLDSQFIPNHTYYFSAWCKAKNKVTSDFSIFLGLGDGGPDLVNYFTETRTPLTTFTDTNWKLLSFIYKYTESSASDNARFSIWATNNPDELAEGSKDKIIGDNILYMSRFILVDLTKHFGEGKEPSKDWCDKNTKEHHTFVNLGSEWEHENGRGALWTPDNEFSFNFKDIKAVPKGITPPEFPDYMYSIQGKPYVSDKEPNLECFLNGPLVSQVANLIYYISYDAKTTASADKNLGTQVYWGGKDGNQTTTEPPMGASIPLSTTWKKISFLNGRPFQTKYITSNVFDADSYEEATYTPRIDFDSNQTTEFMDVTNISCVGLEKNLEEYNKQEKLKTLADIKRKDINIHWCDRWITGENSTFIHIGDPSFKEPFFTNGIVTANDIIIKPETNTITVDMETGTVTCKKLIIL